jgi:protease-4
MVLVIVFIGFGFLLRMGGKGFQSMEGASAPKNSILVLDLEGVIWNGKRFLKLLDDHADNDNVKAVLISVDSPGGAVGPSQEINAALKRVRAELKKPVICHTSGVMASGAYYAAVACDKILTAPGALIGSIGVIMEFANLEKLYDWAKVSRYTITSGRYKDSGSEYRAMREDERALFQDMINEVYQQFRSAVSDGRPQIKSAQLDEYADGRVFTGAKAVETGFADATATWDEAITETAKVAGLGENYELFRPSLPRRPWWEMGEEEDPVNALTKAARELLRVEGLQRPMYIMPGVWK